MVEAALAETREIVTNRCPLPGAYEIVYIRQLRIVENELHASGREVLLSRAPFIKDERVMTSKPSSRKTR